jgi:hypothetical protein
LKWKGLVTSVMPLFLSKITTGLMKLDVTELTTVHQRNVISKHKSNNNDVMRVGYPESNAGD